jgi:hypothetical protein
MIIANAATFPNRASILRENLSRIASQVDVLNLVLNEFDEVPAELAVIRNLNAILPDRDYKDVGKFVPQVGKDDYVVLVDDDIVYPKSYVAEMVEMFEALPLPRKVLGVHGVIYSDFFEGSPASRCVYPFQLQNTSFRVVNQLGTGTVVCRGEDFPPIEVMHDSQRFVDVRFASWQHRRGVPMVCVPRSSGWLREGGLPGTDSIFSTFTHKWPEAVTLEAQGIAGFSRIDPFAVATLLDWASESGDASDRSDAK